MCTNQFYNNQLHFITLSRNASLVLLYMEQKIKFSIKKILQDSDWLRGMPPKTYLFYS